MDSNAYQRKQAILENVVPRLEADGFAVFVRPTETVLPDFLTDARPDLVAYKGDKKMAMQILTEPEPSSGRTARVHKALAAHPDWEFRLIRASSITLQDDVPLLPKALIEERLGRVLTTVDRTGAASALLMAWAALEAAARRLIPGGMPRPQPTASLIERLASDGYVMPEDADLLLSLGRTRDAVAHGALDTDPGREQVEALVAIVRSLLDFEDETAQ